MNTTESILHGIIERMDQRVKNLGRKNDALRLENEFLKRELKQAMLTLKMVSLEKGTLAMTLHEKIQARIEAELGHAL